MSALQPIQWTKQGLNSLVSLTWLCFLALGAFNFVINTNLPDSAWQMMHTQLLSSTNLYHSLIQIGLFALASLAIRKESKVAPLLLLSSIVFYVYRDYASVFYFQTNITRFLNGIYFMLCGVMMYVMFSKSQICNRKTIFYAFYLVVFAVIAFIILVVILPKLFPLQFAFWPGSVAMKGIPAISSTTSYIAGLVDNINNLLTLISLLLIAFQHRSGRSLFAITFGISFFPSLFFRPEGGPSLSITFSIAIYFSIGFLLALMYSKEASYLFRAKPAADKTSFSIKQSMLESYQLIHGAKAVLLTAAILVSLSLSVNGLIEHFSSMKYSVTVGWPFLFASLSTYFIYYAMWAGLQFLSIQRAKGDKINLAMLKLGFRPKAFFSMMGYVVIQGLMVAFTLLLCWHVGTLWAGLLSNYRGLQELMFVLSILIISLFALYAFMRTYLVLPIIISQNCNPIRAWHQSIQATKSQALKLMGLSLCNLLLIISIGVLTLGIGLIWLIPYLAINRGVVFNTLYQPDRLIEAA